MIKKRISRIQKHLKNGDMFYIADPANIFYFSGFTGTFARLIIYPKKAVFITDSRYQGAVKKSGIEKAYKVIITKDLKTDIEKMIRPVKKIYFPFTTPLRDYLNLKKRKIKTAVSGIPDEIRMIKDEKELECIKKAALITAKGIIHIADNLKAGADESGLAAEFEYYIKKQGADGVSFRPIIAFNENSAIPHSVNSDKKLAKNTLVLMDCGVKYKGYCSDLTRCIAFRIIGARLKKIKKNYEIVRKTKQYSAGFFKPNALIKNADAEARVFLKKHGLEKLFTHSLGHSMGIDIHEQPFINAKENRRFRQGMVFTCEPGIYFEGSYGIRIEDDYVITKKGAEKIGAFSDKLILR
ncbi:MAG: M24 family metallopeptidase [bacterium]